jgi:hypothetical protein
MNGPVLFCGDPHGKFRHIVKAGTELHASAVVLLGDMESARPLDEELQLLLDARIPVYLIHGNHDTDSEINFVNLWDNKLAANNIDCRVVVLPDGRRLAGLAGVFRGSIWDPGLSTPPNFRNRKEHAKATPQQARWRQSVPLRHWSTIYPDHLDKVADLRADILVTHQAPGYHNHGFQILDDLSRSIGACVTLHAHEHDSLDSSDRWVQQGFKSHAVGLRGITSIDMDRNATVIVPGELDEQRNYRQKYIDVFKNVPPEEPT